MCDLEGIANSLIAYARVNSSSIDMELAKRMISHRVKLEWKYYSNSPNTVSGDVCILVMAHKPTPMSFMFLEIS